MREDKGVRLRYSGLIIFSSRVLSTAVGLAFALIVVRRLSPVDYGLWQFIGALAPYFTLPSTSLPYWALRDVAEGPTWLGRAS